MNSFYSHIELLVQEFFENIKLQRANDLLSSLS